LWNNGPSVWMPLTKSQILLDEVLLDNHTIQSILERMEKEQNNRRKKDVQGRWPNRKDDKEKYGKN